MYNPKDVFTEEGYDKYKAHLNNIKEGLNYIMNHYDDLHIGALSSEQENDWFDLYGAFEKLSPVLKNGDGEKYEN